MMVRFLNFPDRADDLRQLKIEQSSFQIIKWLGEGVSSQVCVVEKQDSRRFTKQRVVLKILKSEKRVQWLRREFEVLRDLRSLHCVQLYGWENFLDHGPALIMEEIRGVSLHELRKIHAFNQEQALEIARQIQVGLADLHRLGFAHGDLSLKNIMLDIDGSIRLIDFGIPPESNQLIATPAYAAPELWLGGSLTPARDLFSLGLLYSDLQGERLQIPAQADEARARCFMNIKAGDPWLEEIPEKRGFKVIGVNSIVRSTLGELVQTWLKRKEESENLAQTMPFTALHSTKDIGLRAFARAVLFLTVSIFPLAFVSSKSERHINSIKTVTLEIRPVHWREIWLDGRYLGFSPLQVVLQGNVDHLLSWKSRKQSGQMIVKWTYGEKKTFTEQDFLKQNLEISTGAR